MEMDHFISKQDAVNSSMIIADKMERIRSIFQAAQELVSKKEDVYRLISTLEEENSEFLSVAYEGAAMEFALQDLAKGNSIPSWNSFMSRSEAHAPQVYVGLGWAIAREKPANLSFLDHLYPHMQFRVWDGCGYYDGIFRHRQVIKNQARLEYIPEKDFKGYDEGLGRSLWYSCKGDENKLPEMIQNFAPERHPDLWRGIGIACSYVGGCNETLLKTLSALAGKHNIQLGIGAAMVAKSRILTNCMTPDMELSCNIFCKTTAQEAMQAVNRAEAIDNYSFEKFLLQMEEAGVGSL